MTRVTSLRPYLLASLGGMLGAAALLLACGSKANAVQAGGECFLATDCAPGLVCVEKADKTRACTNDLSRVAGEPPDPPAADAALEAGEAGPADAVADAPVRDTFVPDTNVPDTNPPVDAADQ